MKRTFFSVSSQTLQSGCSASVAARFSAKLSAWMLVLLALCAVQNNHSLLAQTVSNENRSSKGKDFAITFLPNYHDGRGSSGLVSNDSLFIFITCDVATQGLITWRNSAGQSFSRAFQITNPNQIYATSFFWRDIELLGFNDSKNASLARSQNERVAPQSFRITAQSDVTIYGLNQAWLTSDAFLALPVTSLGKEYVVMSYTSDGYPLLSSASNPDASTPSEFAVVATDDNTEVRITPRAPTYNSRSTNPQTVRLNRGDVYLVQADIFSQNGFTDLTGSRVVATKPVAVFGGHQRALLPTSTTLRADGLLTRDHLVEQLPSLETWGKSAFLTPYVRPATGESGIGTDLYRVLAAYDTTKIFLNGALLRTLNAGEIYEAPLNTVGWITASDQILVAQFKKTSTTQFDQSVNRSYNGDPFMMIVPTVEQYDKSYRFINVQVRDPLLSVPSLQVFEEHFVTIVAPTTTASSVLFDNSPVGAGVFQPIVNSGYSYANLRVSGGVHTARADLAFGIYVYGYGYLNSYGYIGGGKLKVIAPDRTPPVITGRDTCSGFNGMVYDSLETDSGIRSVEFEQTTFGNITATRDQFTPYPDSVRFRVRLQNMYRDGGITVVARDSIGFETRRTVFVPGFTVGAEGQLSAVLPVTQSVTIETGRSRAFPVVLTNYGTTTQTLTTFAISASANTGQIFVRLGDSLIAQSSANAGITTFPLPPTTLLPGQSTTVTVGFSALVNGSTTIRLSFGNPCLLRDMMLLTIASGKDTLAPTITTTPNYCDRTIAVTVQDAEPFPSGIAAVQLVGTPVNCTLQLQPAVSGIANSLLVRGTITILNPRLDAIYSVRVLDSAGNQRVLTDTIQGFTLQLTASTAERNDLGTFGEKTITAFWCRTIEYRNIGVKPFTIEQLAPLGNTYFSLPPSQFPLTIPAGGTQSFQVCFSPLETRDYRDTIKLGKYCVQDVILLTGTGSPLSRDEITRCNAEVRLTTSTAPLQYFMEQNFPNPSSGLTTIRFGMSSPAKGTLTLFNSLGEVLAKPIDAYLPIGVLDVTLDVSGLENGVYFYELRSGGTHIVRQLVVIR